MLGSGAGGSRLHGSSSEDVAPFGTGNEPPADASNAIPGPQGPSYPGGPPPSANGPPPAEEDMFIYPQSGQSPEQQADDRYECHAWATQQTGFDPTQAGGGVAPEQTVAKGADYRRAMRACLEGRGYSVR